MSPTQGAVHDMVQGREEEASVSHRVGRCHGAASMSWGLNDEQCFCLKRSAGKPSWEKRIPPNTGQIPANAWCIPGVVSCVRWFMCVVYWWHGAG